MYCVWRSVFIFLFFSFHSGKNGLPDPEVLVEKLLKRRTFRPDPQGSNIMFAFFAQHFTHQFFKTYNRMGLGFTKALSHGVSLRKITNLSEKIKIKNHKSILIRSWCCERARYEPLNSCFILLLMQVDAGHIYGDNLKRQHNLRLLKDGKLKYQVRHAE